jgi:hypothetical protein
MLHQRKETRRSSGVVARLSAAAAVTASSDGSTKLPDLFLMSATGSFVCTA